MNIVGVTLLHAQFTVWLSAHCLFQLITITHVIIFVTVYVTEQRWMCMLLCVSNLFYW